MAMMMNGDARSVNTKITSARKHSSSFVHGARLSLGISLIRPASASQPLRPFLSLPTANIPDVSGERRSDATNVWPDNPSEERHCDREDYHD